jgi:hypothetical protein
MAKVEFYVVGKNQNKQLDIDQTKNEPKHMEAFKGQLDIEISTAVSVAKAIAVEVYNKRSVVVKVQDPKEKEFMVEVFSTPGLSSEIPGEAQKAAAAKKETVGAGAGK